MKQILFIAMLCVLSIATKAQTMTNNNPCGIKITAVCYDPTTCAIVKTCQTVVIAGHGVGNMPVCPATDPCPSGTLQGYVICFNNMNCTACTTIGQCGMAAYPCPNFTDTAQLLSCDICPTLTVTCTTTGNYFAN